MFRYRWVIVLVFLVLATACDSDQPLLDTSQQLVEIRLSTTAIPQFGANLYDRYNDVDNDDVLDPGDTPDGTLCEFFQPDSPTDRPAPWPFTVEIKLIRAGTVIEEVLTTANSAVQFQSLTPGDPEVLPAPPVPQEAFPNDGKIYLNPRQVMSTSNQYLDLCLRPGGIPIPEFDQVGGIPTPVQFQLVKGDVVIVTAGQGPPPPYESVLVQGLLAEIFVDGVEIDPDGEPDSANLGGLLRCSYRFR